LLELFNAVIDGDEVLMKTMVMVMTAALVALFGTATAAARKLAGGGGCPVM
jgi:hypothetical protein